jgi:CopG family transcriptional regulator/antitoxin EndoAI
VVSSVKRIMISLPESLLAEVDGLVSSENRNRSEFIREAMKLYLAERKRYTIREQMKRGYQEMAQINLALATEQYEVEEEMQSGCDKRLVECK